MIGTGCDYITKLAALAPAIPYMDIWLALFIRRRKYGLVTRSIIACTGYDAEYIEYLIDQAERLYTNSRSTHDLQSLQELASKTKAIEAYELPFRAESEALVYQQKQAARHYNRINKTMPPRRLKQAHRHPNTRNK